EPITTLQPGPPFTPVVLGPERIPLVTSVPDATREPELAVLSVLAHGREARAAEVGRAALAAAARLDDERRTLYTDLALYRLGGAVRDALEIEMNLSDYEFKSEFFKRRIAEETDKATRAAEARGEARGRAAADAQAILTVLSARGIGVSDDVRARILACA